MKIQHKIFAEIIRALQEIISEIINTLQEIIMKIIKILWEIIREIIKVLQELANSWCHCFVFIHKYITSGHLSHIIYAYCCCYWFSILPLQNMIYVL